MKEGERALGIAIASRAIALATVDALQKLHGEPFVQAFKDAADVFMDRIAAGRLPHAAQESYSATIRALAELLPGETLSVPSQTDEPD